MMLFFINKWKKQGHQMSFTNILLAILSFTTISLWCFLFSCLVQFCERCQFDVIWTHVKIIAYPAIKKLSWPINPMHRIKPRPTLFPHLTMCITQKYKGKKRKNQLHVHIDFNQLRGEARRSLNLFYTHHVKQLECGVKSQVSQRTSHANHVKSHTHGWNL